MPFPTAATERLRILYHWQPFIPERLEATLRNHTIYCSRPSDFNDPWDCRPFFNTEFLDDPENIKKSIEWAVRVCKQDGRMSEEDLLRMAKELENRDALDRTVRQITEETLAEVLQRYRVYCLCPDVENTLMWSHYADSHRGVCLEFNVRNELICQALEVQYHAEFPMTAHYVDDPSTNLLPLLAKSDCWAYEHEFRLIAQERGNATPHETLFTDNGQLSIPDGALSAVIVGCQGNFDDVEALVRDCGSRVAVRNARRAPNRFALEIPD